MGSNADDSTKQAGDTGVAPPSVEAQASQPLSHLEKQPAAVRPPQAQSDSRFQPDESSDARSGSSPSGEPEGLEEAQLEPLQDADLVVDFSLPLPHPRAQSDGSRGNKSGSTPAEYSQGVQPASSLPGTEAATEGQRKAAGPGIRSSPFALGHSTDSASSSAQLVPASLEAGKSVQAPPEVQAHISLQPATPPLHTPAGPTPASRPASEQEGEPPPSGALRQGSLHGIAKGIQAAIERKLRYVSLRAPLSNAACDCSRDLT